MLMAEEIEIFSQMESNSLSVLDDLNFDEISNRSFDFEEWISLISNIEKTYPDDIENLCLVYDSFLSKFPLCHGYWRKYASHKTRLCTVDKVVEVFERAVQAATYSVSLWLDYCCFSISVFEDQSDICRIFRRALSFVGKDYSCSILWDNFIAFESSRRQWESLALIYIQALKFPSRKLHSYYDRFKKLTCTLKEQIQNQSNITMETEAELDMDSPICLKDSEISTIIKNMLNPYDGADMSRAVNQYLSIGERLYREACKVDTKISNFEKNIGRTFFHVKPLNASQLKNWHCYLDFVELYEDFDWAVKLYERCLIPCANYPEFWMRYVDFLDTKGGREIANFALDRATQIFLKEIPMIHLFHARFKEKIGDISGAHSAFLQLDSESESDFIENITMKANMERRSGNFETALTIYKKALEIALAKKQLLCLPSLYINFSRLQYMISNDADKSRDILIDGIRNVSHCKLLLLELIQFAMMHGGSNHINAVDSIVADALFAQPNISQGWNAKDAEEISKLYLEFVDLCGTIDDIRRVWKRHMKSFPFSTKTSFMEQTNCSKPVKSAEEETIITVQSCPEKNNILTEKVMNGEVMESSLMENNGIDSDQAIIDQTEAENITRKAVQGISPEVQEHFGKACESVLAGSLQDNLIETESMQDIDHGLNQGVKQLSLDSNPHANGLPEESRLESGICRNSESSQSFPRPQDSSTSGLNWHQPQNSGYERGQQHESGSRMQETDNSREFLTRGHTQNQFPVLNDLASTFKSGVHPETDVSEQSQYYAYSMEQYGQTMNSQAYAQMWQNYYYQQQHYQMQQNAYQHYSQQYGQYPQVVYPYPTYLQPQQWMPQEENQWHEEHLKEHRQQPIKQEDQHQWPEEQSGRSQPQHSEGSSYNQQGQGAEPPPKP